MSRSRSPGQSSGSVRGEQVCWQEQPLRRPARHQRGLGSQKKKTRAHNIIYDLRRAMRLRVPIGIFRKAVKEWTAALRLSGEADLALESQGPLDDWSLFRVHMPACAFEAMEIHLLQTQDEVPCHVLARKSTELPEGVMGAMSGLGHRMIQVM